MVSPYDTIIEEDIAAQTAAVTADTVLGEAPFAGEVTSVEFIPEANISGATATARTLTLVNKGADGNGTTVIATLAFIDDIDATDFNSIDFTLSVVADATNIAEGDVLVLSEAVTSTGTANPGGKIKVHASRSYA